MNNLIKSLIGFSFILIIGSFVYALVQDTDGGYNIVIQGTCTDIDGNYTDYCEERITLIEYYPSNYTMGNQTIEYCASEEVTCPCTLGKCNLFLE